MSHFFRCAIILALFSISAPIALHADSLPPAYAAEVLTVVAGAGAHGDGVYYGFSGYPYMIYRKAVYNTPGFEESVGVTAGNVGGSNPGVASRLGLSGELQGTLPRQTFDSISNVGYGFEVNGPVGQTVPVNFAGSGFATVNTSYPNFGSEALLDVSPLSSGGAPSSYLLNAIGCAGDASVLTNPTCSETPGAPTNFNVNTTLEVQTDTAYIVHLWAETYFSAILSGSSPTLDLDAVAEVDPTITLDITDPDYSLSFSPGLMPGASPVPEPSTLPLTLSGIAALAFACTLRRVRSIASVTMCREK